MIDITTQQFLDSLTPEWTKQELNDLTSTYGKLDHALRDTKCNVYHLCWVRPDITKRASDKDVILKKYFAVDIDLYNNFKDWKDVESPLYPNTGIEICKWEILIDAYVIAEVLKEHWELGKWRYIVFSWRWIHIYYTWTPRSFNAHEYALWVGKIFKVIHEALDNYEPYKPDDACKNIWRIMRLPWSYNQKNWELVHIIYHQDTDSQLFDDIEKYAEEERKIHFAEIEREQTERARKFEEDRKLDALISKNKYVDTTEQLEAYIRKLDSTPTYLVSEKLLPQFKWDDRSRKNFHSDNPANRWTAFYYCEDINAICNWWSHHYSWGTSSSCYSSTQLVHNQLWCSWADVFKWFESNFGIPIDI